LEVCEKRDVKRLYKKAKAGLIKNYTGVSSPYERPDADLVLNTADESLETCVESVIKFLSEKGILNANPKH